MTYEEMKRAAFGELIPPTKLSFPTLPNKAVPQAQNAFNVSPPRPLTQEDYNNIPLAQMQEVSKYRGMDDWHRNDAIAADFDRGTKLNAIAKVEGKEKFVEHYKTSKK